MSHVPLLVCYNCHSHRRMYREAKERVDKGIGAL
ncbi:hypothetical protein LCGC14_2741820, partial [marine sediment metagenome]